MSSGSSSSRKSCVTRARLSPSRRAISAREHPRSISACQCRTLARASPAANARLGAGFRDLGRRPHRTGHTIRIASPEPVPRPRVFATGPDTGAIGKATPRGVAFPLSVVAVSWLHTSLAKPLDSLHLAVEVRDVLTVLADAVLVVLGLRFQLGLEGAHLPLVLQKRSCRRVSAGSSSSRKSCVTRRRLSPSRRAVSARERPRSISACQLSA